MIGIDTNVLVRWITQDDPYLSHIRLSEQEEKLWLAALWLPKNTTIKYFNWNP